MKPDLSLFALLTALFGESIWTREYKAFCSRDWRGHEIVFLWADDIYINARASDRRCVLVLIGCDAHGRKNFLAVDEGFRESAESWNALLLGLRDRGRKTPPKLAVGDGAMGFWATLTEVSPQTRQHRNVSTYSQHIGDDFYVTTSGSPVLTGVGEVLNRSGLSSSSAAICPSSGLIETTAGGRAT